ncbi:MAG: hypothetical protein ABIJ09_23510 [Pseudomonadota bacterium]
MQRGWLERFLQRYVGAHDVAAVEWRVGRILRPWTTDRKGAAKRWIFWSLHRRGVAYGLPLARPELLNAVESGAWKEAFEPFLAIWCDLIIEIEAVSSSRVRTEQVEAWLLCCLALLVEQDAMAVQLFQVCQGHSLTRRQLTRIRSTLESMLAARQYAVGNPLLGLPLRNGLLYSDARLVGRITLAVAASGGVDLEVLSKLRAFFQRERYMLVASLGALVAGGQGLPPEARRMAAGQLGGCGFSRGQVRALKRLLEQPLTASQVADMVEGRRSVGYLLEQVLLAAVIDGHIDRDERRFVDQLAAQLEVPDLQLRRIEVRVRRFVEAHRDLFDLFTETQYYGRLGGLVQKRVVGLVQRNLDALVTEIRQTGELATLLTRAAGGHSLDDSERARVREQLLDIVRAVPSLALFALPGGALLLPIVLRLLPWDLRPSAFRDAPSRRRGASS